VCMNNEYVANGYAHLAWVPLLAACIEK
jgi:hypothetical protein